MNQTRPESGINPLSPNPNSFSGNHKNIKEKGLPEKELGFGERGFIPDSGRVWFMN